MRTLAAIILLVAFYHAANAGNFRPVESIPLAQSYVIQSEALSDERSISISLPENYATGDHRYPVIYLLDGGQNMPHAVGTRDVLTRSGDMPPVILVGLKSVNRNLDMTPSKMTGNDQSGGANQLLAHLQQEVMPFIDQNYRTNQFQVLAGHSLGGLFATHVLFEQPDLFDAYIVMAPALWWNNEEAIERAKEFFMSDQALEKSLFFGIGADDGWGMRQELQRFVAEAEASQREGLRWKHQEFENEGHMSATLRIFYHGVKFIFSDLRLPQHIRDDFNVDAFLAHETAIKNKYGSAARQSQEIYVTTGFALLEKSDFDGAVAVFKRNEEAYAAHRYPRNNAWLANAYEKAGANGKALAEYQKAYDLAVETGYGDKDMYQQKISELSAESE